MGPARSWRCALEGRQRAGIDRVVTDRQFERLQGVILASPDVDLVHCKKPQMQRRLTGYVARSGLTVRDFCERLARDRLLTRDLKEFITINVTE